MVGDLKWTVVKERAPGTTAEVRQPNATETANKDASNLTSRNQAQSGGYPMPGETPTYTPKMPQMTPAKLPSDAVPSTPVRSNQTQETPSHPSTTPQQPTHDTAAQEKRLLEGRGYSNKLTTLTQGGHKAQVMTPYNPHQAPASGMRALPQNIQLGRKDQPQTDKSKTAVADGRHTPQAHAKDETGVKGKVRHPGESAGDTSTDGKLAEHVVQQNPFAAKSQTRPSGAERREVKDDIKSDRRALDRLGSVTDGVARGITAASGTHEFSGGSYQGGFGDPQDGSPGLAHKVSTVPHMPVFGEAVHYVETAALYAHLGLNKMLHGSQELYERVKTEVGTRIANTKDDVPFSQRFSDAAHLEQAALGGHYSPYGKGVYG